jgi:UDP-N-acetylglucosamine 2-epimerase (non-hydrolysing)
LKKLLFIFGTRPEAIKMAPLILEARRHANWCEVKICVTAQHRQMLDQVLQFFELTPDYDLQLMKPDQTLFDITANGLLGLAPVLENYQPDVVLVQGDTTTAFIGALAAFYRKIKVAHIEAGLRSHNKLSPYPEEVNRKLAGVITDFHFAPTDTARENLLQENIRQDIFVVGNSVIDALLLALQKVKQHDDLYRNYFNFLLPGKNIILVTGHRRESFGEPFEQICYALKKIAADFPDCQIVYPVHLNPNVKEPVNRILQNQDRVFLIEPLDYPYLVWLLSQSYLVLTDSGGIQEEAPALGKPVLVMRNVTERTEGIEAGTARLVGTGKDDIVNNVTELLRDGAKYKQMANAVNPYGNGTTATSVIQQLKQLL